MPASKRRKLEHVSSDEDDDASFASFEEDVEGSVEDESMDGTGNLSQGQWGNIDGCLDGEHGGTEGDEVAGSPNQDVEEASGETSISNGRSNVEQLAKPVRPTTQRRPGVDMTSMTGGSKSNMFKLQVNELLGQIRPRRGKRDESADQALHVLKKTMEALPARPAQSIAEAEKQLKSSAGIIIPFPVPKPPKDAKYKLEFARPSNINVVGSYVLKTQTMSEHALCIDMTVTMPSSLFQEKDYLNYRYFYKRAHYLACLAAGICETHGNDFDASFAPMHDDQLKPALLITPKAKHCGGDIKPPASWRVYILPCVQADLFLADKLLPQKNCVRPGDDAALISTPVYNSSLRADMLMTSYLKLLHGAVSRCEGFRDAVLLGRVWLRQRGFGSSLSDGGFGTFEWSVMLALLLQGGGPGDKAILSETYSSYQLFKATIQFLAAKDLAEQAFIVGTGEMQPLKDGSPMLWDAARSHNVLYRVLPWSYAELRQEARTTLSALGNASPHSFDATFIVRLDQLLRRYDYVAQIPTRSLAAGNDKLLANLEASKKLYAVLKRGLSDRASLISLRLPSAALKPVNSALPAAMAVAAVSVGINVNADNVGRTVDRGPSAENKAEAASFRKFWGEKSELRRLKDGSIMETLVWNGSESGMSVIENIIRYLLSRHFQPAAGTECIIYGQGLERILKYGSGITPFQPLAEAYKQMEMDIRALEDMPLSIRQIMPADPQLRFASVRPPVLSPGRQRPIPADVTIQFEASARWPEDVAAIQRTKIAFLLKLSELLRESKSGLTSRVGLENEGSAFLNHAYLDIVYESGAAFRMRIHHDREQSLLERQLKDKVASHAIREAASLALAKHKRDYIRSPTHTQAVTRLCNRYGALSGTMRLVKQWFASHLLTEHVQEAVIELMAIRNFVQPWPWQTPASAQTGFLRTLHWLARWDWRNEPLIVDISGSGELTTETAHSIRSRFEAWRKLDPALNRVTLFAASNIDTDGTTWTDLSMPPRVVAGRMTALAKAATDEVDTRGHDVEPANLFTSSLSDFDFVLHLNASFAGAERKKGDRASFKNLELAEMDDETLVGFDAPRLFLQELTQLYGSAILFFSGGTEKPIIAGLWNPQTTSARAWKVNLAYSTTPKKALEENETHAEINKDGILAEIAALGGDLLSRIDVKKRRV